MEWVLSGKRSFMAMLVDALSYTEQYELLIPGDVVDRTRLMCLYIEDEVKESFGLSEFLLLLYKDFINYAVKNPLPDRILKEATRKSVVEEVEEIEEEEEFIKIVCNGVEYLEKPINNEIDEKKKSKKNASKKEVRSFNRNKIVHVKLDKREAKKGEIILDELYVTKGVMITMEELLTSLWINFIDDYRNGTNKRAYKSIVQILKKLNLK